MILKGVFPIDQLDKITKIMAKTANLKAHALQENHGLSMEVVFMGEAVNLLTQREEYRLAQSALMNHGVSLVACQNAMKHHQLHSEDLIPAAQEAVSGVGQVIQRQMEGWGVYWC